MSKTRHQSVPALAGPSPVESIRGVHLLVRRRQGFRFTATSLPGHLVQFILKGRVRQSCNGRVYDLGPGDAIWYHEDEWVEGVVRDAPWIFYSVNFLAPGLPPPDYARRVVRPRGNRLLKEFQLLRESWQGGQGDARDFHCHAHLLLLLSAWEGKPVGGMTPVSERQLWWDMEMQVRAGLELRYRLADLARMARRSPATLTRACRAATGSPPMRRIKQIRLSLAQGLVIHSELRINEIARRVGYERLHEFSRDFSAFFGVSPRQERVRKGRISSPRRDKNR